MVPYCDVGMRQPLKYKTTIQAVNTKRVRTVLRSFGEEPIQPTAPPRSSRSSTPGSEFEVYRLWGCLGYRVWVKGLFRGSWFNASTKRPEAY